ncbi:MAG: sugar ABC transporter permease [Chloroflexi bacterium]|nr:sugar ABC transporter permease [Chloroflexota bacterium]
MRQSNTGVALASRSLSLARTERWVRLRRGLRRRGVNQGLLFVAPALLLYAAFVIYPVVETWRLSVMQWDGIQPQRFVGLANYVTLFTNDPIFLLGVRNNLYWMAFSIPLQLVFGLALALLLNQGLAARAFYRGVFFSPVTISTAVIAVVWGTILGPQGGTFNNLLTALGLGSLTRAWLGDPGIALFAAIGVNVWRFIGYSMVLYLAGMQSIPLEYYEAARVDGASVWQQVRHVTLPLLTPTTVTLTILGVIRTMREFDLVYVLTKGGPAHQSELVSLHIFNQGFLFSKLGYGSAVAVVLLIATIILTVIQLRLYDRYGKIYG